jgi:creatinase
MNYSITESIATQKVWTAGEMKRRLTGLYEIMDEKGLEAVIFTSIHNVLYYTGFYCPPVGRLHSAVIPRKGEPALIVSTIEDLRANYCCYYKDIRHFPDWDMSPMDNNIRLYLDVLKDNGISSGRLGYEEDTVSVQFQQKLSDKLGVYDFVDVAYDTMMRRTVKSEEEIDLIRHGVEICEVGGYAAVNALKPGITEVEAANACNVAIAAELRKRFPDIEYDDLNNKCLFQTGPYRSRIGHTMNAHRVVQKGEMMSNNPYCIIAGFYHVLERSMYWGNIPDEAMAYFKTNVSAHYAGLKALKAGIKCSDIDQHVNAVYEEAGINWRTARSFGTGHSLGIMTYWFGREEGPELRQFNDNVLQENMVVTMEPMINVDGLGGFRHHDICRITKDGIENLNTFPNGVLLVDDQNNIQEIWKPE